MKCEKEPGQPDRAILDLVGRIAGSIGPDDPNLKGWYDSYVSNHSRRIAFDVDIIRKLSASNKKIIEFGAVPLLLSSALKASGYPVVSIDILPERFSSAIRRLDLEVIKCNFETEPLPFGEGTFDLVVFNEIFEHLRINLIRTMEEVRRILKPGGILLLSTPNLRSLRGIWNFVVEKVSYSCAGDLYYEYQKLNQIGHMGHVREYTPLEVIAFTQRIGFHPLKIIYRGAYYGLTARAVTGVFPGLRPFFSLVSSKT